MSLLKKIGLAVTSLIAVGSSLHAASMDERVTQLESSMNEIRAENAMKTYGVTTATSQPWVDGSQWFVTLDPIFWNARLGGTEYAWRTNQPTPITATSFPLKGHAKDVGFDWNFGIKAGVGHLFEHDQWDVYFEYTYYSTDGSSSASSGLNASVISLRGSSVITDNNIGLLPTEWLFATLAKTTMDLKLQRFDLELGRGYFISPKVAFRPHVGLTGAFIDIKQKSRYTGGTIDNGGLGINTVHIRDESDVDSLGPHIGIETNWFLGRGFSFMCDFNTAFLYGYFDSEHKEKFSPLSDNRIDVSESFHRVIPEATINLGLSWGRYWRENSRHFEIALSYECQYYWRANQMIDIDDTQNLRYEFYTEDVSFQGLTLELRLDF